MNQVFIVTSGEYSAYRIESVWATLDEAQAALAVHNNRAVYADGRIEVYAFGATQRTLGKFGRRLVLGWPDGATVSDDTWDSSYLTPEPHIVVGWWDTAKTQIHLDVEADTRERCDKVFTETRARLLADMDLRLPFDAIRKPARQP